MRLPKEDLLRKVLDAIDGSEWRFRSPYRLTHPLKLTITKDQLQEELLIYIWNITHGGRTRAADEYRIQITGVRGIDIFPNTKTLLLGWDDRRKVYAGFNASRYTSFGASPSLQVKEGTLLEAQKKGLAIQPKERDETGNITEAVAAISPEFLVSYILSLDSYHGVVQTEREIEILQEATVRPIQEEEMIALPEERRRVVREVNQLLRSTRFRRDVLDAYHHRCAICGLQLGIVTAAHIVPVQHGGTDAVSNGIALCPNHHEALDRGLIAIDANYRIVVNEEYLARLRSSGKLGGIEDFMRNLRPGERISFPTNPKLRPRREYLKTSMELKGFPLT